MEQSPNNPKAGDNVDPASSKSGDPDGKREPLEGVTLDAETVARARAALRLARNTYIELGELGHMERDLARGLAEGLQNVLRDIAAEVADG